MLRRRVTESHVANEPVDALQPKGVLCIPHAKLVLRQCRV
jgi:hypothetical protein